MNMDDYEIRITMGPCRACGAETELFPGKTHCDECVRKHEADQVAEQRRLAWRIKVESGEAAGLLSPEFSRYRFRTSRNPGANIGAWKTAMKATGNLFLWGAPGCGKTHLARCLLNNAAYRGKRIAEAPAAQIVRQALSYGADRGLLFRAITTYEAVLIDDIDKPAMRQDTLSALWEILNSRCQPGRRTFITANLSPRALADLFQKHSEENSSLGDATLNRLHPVDVLEMAGPSMRVSKPQPEPVATPAATGRN